MDASNLVNPIGVKRSRSYPTVHHSADVLADTLLTIGVYSCGLRKGLPSMAAVRLRAAA